MSHLGDNIQMLRRRQGLSQEQLAEQLDVTRQTISKWELNQSAPDLNYLCQLSEIFGISLDALVKGEGNPDESVGQALARPRKKGKWLLILMAIVSFLLLIFSGYVIYQLNQSPAIENIIGGADGPTNIWVVSTWDSYLPLFVATGILIVGTVALLWRYLKHRRK